jgi:quinol monooxygenase YgiN
MTTPTFIAIVEFATSSANRSTAVDQLRREQPIVRSMPGCVNFGVFRSAETDTDITIVHEWTDPARFADYLASEAFARSGDVLRPLMIAPPSSRRFRAELIETVV